jgi:hypothetical protein
VTLGPVAQLTLLLLTGRATDSLQDFLGGGGKLTDRVSDLQVPYEEEN